MIHPDARRHNPDPVYLRSLIKQSGMTRKAIAKQIGISIRLLDQYKADSSAASAREAPYAVQFALESLCNEAKTKQQEDRDY